MQGPLMGMDGISVRLKYSYPHMRVTVDWRCAQSELNTNGFISLNHPFENQATQGSTPNKVIQLTTHLQAAVDEVWLHRFGLRYRNVRVLLVSWEADDLGVIKEVRALEHVIRDFYRYDVSTYLITSHHPDRALTRRVLEFVESAMKDTLLLLLCWPCIYKPE